jgi:hypothetical protein
VAELVLVLTDIFTTAGGEARETNDGMPRLPLLEMTLARSRMSALAADWRAWLAERAPGMSAPASTPAATVAAAWDLQQASGQAPGIPGGVWLATPVHYFAGLDSVHLHPQGLLRLDRAAQEWLVTDFARVFADSPWQLRGIGQRELLLSGPAIKASGADPAYFAGSDPSPGLPHGEGAATLRRLGAEMEMWLYEHPLNLERQRRGELPVTALWLWGAQPFPSTAAPSGVLESGAPQPSHQVRDVPGVPGVPSVPGVAGGPRAGARLYGGDTFAEALWRLQGGACAPLPSWFDPALISPDADCVILYPLLQPEGLSAAFTQLERQWLPGALRAVSARRVSVLRLLIGARAYSLRWLDRARFWRSRAPWWETLA